jgi:NAD(P)-dependent dehydrogenase (short-subunit alcohol dehydrogenase family)
MSTSTISAAGPLQDRVCVVTGAAKGIGRATAVEMAAQGSRGVVVCDVDDEAGRETVELVAASGGEAEYVRCDLREEGDIVRLMARAVERFGGIDVLHNNAGVHESNISRRTRIDELELDVWEAVYQVNLRAVWLCTKHATPHLRNSRLGPAIVNSSSVAGLVGFGAAPCYVSTKGAVIQLTKAAAIDLAPMGIRCNCYCPGGVLTPMVERLLDSVEDRAALLKASASTHLLPRRLAEPAEIARLVCFLASDGASFINGSVIAIDAGSMAWRGALED